jgi:hypothetical protein
VTSMRRATLPQLGQRRAPAREHHAHHPRYDRARAFRSLPLRLPRRRPAHGRPRPHPQGARA